MPFAGSLEPLVEEQIERWQVPGVAIGILHQGEREHLGYGVTSIETREPTAPDLPAPFQTASSATSSAACGTASS